jgi:bleomycin hydrolase
MGSNQSRPSDEQEKAALEKLRALQLEKKSGLEGYVYVNSEKDTQGVQAILDSRTPESVPVSRMAEWQDELLDDPKNR